jgi:3-isopropylmalate dehydratase small subunit
MEDAHEGRERAHHRRPRVADRHRLGRHAAFQFDVDPFKKHCLLNGLDDIGLTLEKVSAIDAFEARAQQQFPWA